MNKIHQLPDDIIAKIAAGEVIERPAYAVKELLENSIDAGADSIIIHIEQSGLKKIVVIDNGEGMSREDIQECFKPHTTSKISSIDQLHAIATLGFRGEALSTIAAISNLTIKSKTKDDVAGTIVQLNAGNVVNIAPIGTPVGTSITVDNLFYPVPARKKFLKSLRTEFRHILDIVTNIALAHPEIRFVLTHNNRTIFDLPKTTEQTERIYPILGQVFFEQLIPVVSETPYVQISGFIAKPQITTATQHKQYLFVNKRNVIDKLIHLAVKEAYGNLINTTAYPVFLLSITLPYEVVDVNVHPRKEQVSFINKETLFETVKETIAKTLAENNITFDWKIPNNPGQTKSYAGQLLKQLVLSDATQLIKREETTDIQQIHNLYLLTQTKQGLLIVDQHAAHERILYQELLIAFKKEKNKNQIYKLPKSLTFDLSFSDAEALHENLKQFIELSFAIEPIKNTTFKLTSVPILFKDRNHLKLITQILEDMMLEKSTKAIDQQTNRMIAYLACRAAIKGGDALTKEQSKKLIEQLEKTENNTTCPHGRPTQIEISLQELHRMFRRI